MKKVISVVLSVLMVFCMFAMNVSAKSTQETSLKFNEDGKFKILQMADFQDDLILNGVVKDFIRASIEKEQPDLIVLTGDNISGNKIATGFSKSIDTLMARQAIDEFMSIFEEYGIPVTATFGNHDDDETLVTKEEQLAIYQEYDCFIGYDDYPEIYGCANHNLPIYSSKDENKIAYNLYIIDSGSYDTEIGHGYDYVHDDQVDWYLKTSNELKEANGGELVPSMVFQHIVVKDILETLEECPEGTPHSMKEGDKYIKFKDEYYLRGNMKEGPSPGIQDSREFTAMVNQGDVVAMFFGHDHNDSYEINYKGIDLILTPGFSYQSYSNEDRGFRVITIDENDTSTYESHILQWQDIYASSSMAMNHYIMYGEEYSVWERIVAALKYIPTIPIKIIAGYVF